MSAFSQPADSAERIVRDGLSAADRLRRQRAVSRQIWRIAPVCSAGALAVAVGARGVGLPAAVPLGVLAAGVSAFALFAVLQRRSRPVSDAAAQAIDIDAGSSGELRSANWFASQNDRDAWANFHLVRAAERLQTVSWTDLYPARRATRAQFATAILVIATIALTMTMPEQVRARSATSAPRADTNLARQGTMAGRMLDPELQRQLEELLAAAAAGDLPMADSLASDAELRELLTKLGALSDAALLEALKRALAANPETRSQSTAENMKRLSEQAKRAAEAGSLPKELQNALEKLSDEIQLAQSRESEKADSATAASGAGSEGKMGEGSGADASQELSIQFAKAAEAGGGAGVMMMSSPETSQPGGPPGSGVGGAGSDGMAAAAAEIEAALKQETIEASQDTPGENVISEIRRKTERGTAAVSFTGSRSATFDRSRANAPPPVPEARRTAVQTYFVRKPQ